MSFVSDNRHAFVIQLWLEPRETEDTAEQWRGVIEHIPSSQRTAVSTMDDIVQFITNYVTLFDPVHAPHRSLRSKLRRYLPNGLQDEDPPPTE